MSPTPAEVEDRRQVALLDAATMPVLLAPGITIAPLVKLQGDLEPFDVALENVEGQAERAEISSQDSYQAGSDLMSAIAGQVKLLEELRVAAKKPADDYGKLVQKLIVPLQERFQAARGTLNTKMLRWRNAEEARQRAAQEVIRKQQEEEARRLADAAREQGNEKAAEKIEEMAAAAPTAPAPRIGHANVYGRTQAKRVYWNGAAQDPMAILRAVVEGKLPIHIVEFSKSGMNEQAKKHIESLPEAERVEQVFLGIKITKDEKLV